MKQVKLFGTVNFHIKIYEKPVKLEIRIQLTIIIFDAWIKVKVLTIEISITSSKFSIQISSDENKAVVTKIIEFSKTVKLKQKEVLDPLLYRFLEALIKLNVHQ